MTKPDARRFKTLWRHQKYEDRIIEYSPSGRNYKTIARMNTARTGWRDDALMLAAAPQMRAILEQLRAAIAPHHGRIELTADQVAAIRNVLNSCDGN